ncbi:hypothetical protein V6N13_129633 [Hibiscus sabdariffa]|uniref:AMP-dependent synthetase/ligase domain-containing protein n=1 Tax=Hibiscus sabdariffa TaxID=183260 RepID=A0ABR2SMK7_9ROSI
MAEISSLTIDPSSGFCSSNSTFYSKRTPFPLPSNHSLDITTFISSYPHHGKTAFIDATTGRHLSFPDLWRAVDSVSTCLSDLGIRKGNVVLIISPNSIFFPIVCLSVMHLGAIITTSNPINTSREIAIQMADSKPVLVFTTSQVVPKLAGSSLPIVLLDDERLTTEAASQVKIVTTINEMMKKGATGQIPVRDRVYQDEAASLLYSSGTTGASKGVISSHRNLISLMQFFPYLTFPGEGEQTHICTVPMFHIYGFGAFAIGKLTTGSKVVILSKFDMNEMLSAIEKYRVTCLPLVPPILLTLVKEADRIRKKYDLSSLQSIVCGGAPLGKDLIDRFLEKFPTVEIRQGYALTESTGFGASMHRAEECRKYGSVGLLSPNLEAKIIDPGTGTALNVNQRGELWVRGPSVMKGLGLTETPVISSWPSLERQGLPVDSDEQRVTKKVKNRGDGSVLPGGRPSGAIEHVPDTGNNGDVCMLEDSRDSGVTNVDDVQPKDGAQQSTTPRSYAAAASGPGASEGNGRLRSSMEDIEEHCGKSEHAEASHNCHGNRAFLLSNKQVDEVSAEDLFGPWMVVEDRRRRPRRNDNFGKQMPAGISGSRFEILNNLSGGVDDSSIGASVGGSSKQLNVPAVSQSHVAQMQGHQGDTVNPNKQVNAGVSHTNNGRSLKARIVAMELGRVSEIISAPETGSVVQHQAITIVEEGDGREEGSGSFSRAGLKGIGRKKVQFKKKSDLKLPAGGLSSVCSEMVNIRNDVSRRRFSYGDDISEKPPDDPGLNGGTSLDDTRVTDMLQSDEERDPVLVVD